MKKKEKRYGLLKSILLLIIIALVLTWLIPNGSFSGSGFVEGTMRRVGLEDVTEIIYNGIAFGLDKIVFLLALGCLYGVLSKTSAYERLVSAIAKKFSKHKKLTVVIFSIVIAVLTSFLTQSFAVLLFIPFIVAILKRMDLDKMTVLATTFGSMLVGVMGATFGSEGLVLLDEYLGYVNSGSIWVRLGILGVGLLLFNFFTLSHMNKTKKNAEQSGEIFEIEPPKEDKKRSIVPIVVIGVILFVLVILGFLNWSGYFNVTVFDTFHEYLTTKIVIGEDFYIFNDLLGRYMGAFGTWNLFSLSAIVLLFTIILALCYRIKLDDFLESLIDGIKKVLKPIVMVIAAYILMVIVYMSPYLATIINKLLSLTDSFNIITMSLTALIANIFHTDMGLSGYLYGSFLVTEYADYINPIYTMFISLYGLVQFFVPTSIVLGVGLTTLDVKYKDWLKYIWRFLLGMIVVLLVIFILMTVL